MSKQGVLLPIHNFSHLKSLANNDKIRTSLIKNFYLHSIFHEVLTCSKEYTDMKHHTSSLEELSKLNLFCLITPTLSKGFWAALKWFRMTSDTRLTSVNKPENNQWKMSVSLKTTNEICQWAWKQPMKIYCNIIICQWTWKQPMKMKIYIWIQK